MITEDQRRQFIQLLDQAQTVIILFPDGTQDAAAAAASLYLSLKEAGKNVRLAAPRQPELNLPGLDEVVTEIGNQYLTVSFEYSETAVDKVSYHIGEETNRFYLTIKPKPGEAPLDSSTVDFSYTGVEADLFILLGVQNLEDLEQLYFGYEDTYEKSQLIAIDSMVSARPALSVYPDLSVTQTVGELLDQGGLPVSPEVATMLLQEIEGATEGFATSVAPETFELAAFLLRQGAERRARGAQAESGQGAAPQAEATPQAASQPAQPAQPEIFSGEHREQQPGGGTPRANRNQSRRRDDRRQGRGGQPAGAQRSQDNRQQNRQPAPSDNQDAKSGGLDHQPSDFSPKSGG